MEIRYNHPDEGLRKTLRALQTHGIMEDSRNGPVIRFPEIVTLINDSPQNRVSLAPVRDANPFFHFMEALWMIAGMNDLDPIAFYNEGIRAYSDDGSTLRGTAYGYKWRKHFGYDQLDLAIKRLRDNPTDRRVVMTMWDPKTEWLNPNSKDLSCNLQVIFGTREENGVRVLDMEVTNRSNDVVYGCLGSNVFHFSFLQEYVAYKTGLQVGRYYQVAFNLHGYMENPVFRRCYESANSKDAETSGDWGPAAGGGYEVKTHLLRELGIKADYSLIDTFVRTGQHFDDPYLKAVGTPLVEAYRVFKLKSQGITVSKNKRLDFAAEIAAQCADTELAGAAVNWLLRKKDAELVTETLDKIRNS